MIKIFRKGKIKLVNKKKTIMVVDDSIEFLKEFQEMLQLSGYKTIGFLSGEAALVSVKKEKPDLILLDLKMNGKSGFDVVEELKADSETENIPIIIVAAFISDKDSDYLIKDCKVKKCIQKPIKPLDIVTEIETTFAEMKKMTNL